MARWTAFPHDAVPYTYEAAALKKLGPGFIAG